MEHEIINIRQNIQVTQNLVLCGDLTVLKTGILVMIL